MTVILFVGSGLSIRHVNLKFNLLVNYALTPTITNATDLFGLLLRYGSIYKSFK